MIVLDVCLALTWRTEHSIVMRPTDVLAISTDIIYQTIVQHFRTSDLELAATCCVKLQLSLSTFKSRLKTHLFSTAFCKLFYIPVPPAPL